MTWVRPIEWRAYGVVRAFAVLGVVSSAIGCASGPLSSLRFQNRDPIADAEDRRPIRRPASYAPGEFEHEFDVVVRTEATYALAVPGPIPAANTNALDEVPDSSWFQNRIGARDLTAAELLYGPGAGGPDPSVPLRIRSAKVTGTVPGFIVEDASGARYILKFDPDEPETESGAEVVVQRLLWAAGYNVPENHIVHLERSDLVLAADSTKEAGGEEHPLAEHEVDRLLAAAPRAPGGRGYRALASKYLAGKPVGGYPMAGTRSDDPNDRIAHEHRRDIRAQKVFFAWLGHTDVKVANTLDMWIESPKGSGWGHVEHYLLDFGKALGVWGLRASREVDGYAPHFDYGYALGSLLAFGAWRRPWEGIEPPGLRGVGRYDAEHFDPGVYSPANPFTPFFYADRFDGFWAAKIIARFRPEHIAAAVEAAEYSDPRARDYLVKTIVARQRATLRHWFTRVNPLDRFVVATGRAGIGVCATDLLLEHRLGDPSQTRYAVTAYDWDGHVLGHARTAPGASSGDVCVSSLKMGRTHAGYTMVVYETFRGDRRTSPVVVHLARHPATGRLRVIGVERR
jgi:hypothetical protein